MKLEIKEVTQQEFDAYWTPEVCNLLNQYIHNTKWWATDFDGPTSSKKWVVDEDRGITYIGMNVRGAEHPSQLIGQDVAVVAKDGSIGLVKHRHDESFCDVYRILLLTGRFSESKDLFKEAVLTAVELGGLGLNGRQQMGGGLLFPLSEKVTFEN